MADLMTSNSEASFHREHPGYADTAVLDDLRATDFARLDRDGHVYLDYTGGGMFASSQVAQHMELLESGVFGNPHSINPTSAASSELVERARGHVLGFFSASPQEYEAIFTPNATGALRLVGEAYPFRAGDRFLLTFDNHNSVNGIREFARARGAETTYIPSVAPDLRVDESLLPRYLTDTIGDHHNLFAYPAQSNFSGCAASARVDRAGTRTWLGRAAGRCRVCADERAGPERLPPGFCRDLVLQDVRLADRRGVSVGSTRRAREARAAVVLGRHDRRGLRTARVLSLRPRAGHSNTLNKTKHLHQHLLEHDIEGG